MLIHNHPKYSNLLFWTFILFLFSSFDAMAQQRQYYYYGDKQIDLELNQQYLYLSLDEAFSNRKQLERNLDEGLEVLSFGQDEAILSLKNVSGKKNSAPSYWAEVKVDRSFSQADYFTYVESLKEKTGVLWSSPFFTDADGHRVGVSQYFYVKLNTEEDFQLLQEYCAKNEASIVGQKQIYAALVYRPLQCWCQANHSGYGQSIL